MQKILFVTGALMIVLLCGCASSPKAPSVAEITSSQRWFLDPNVTFGSYKTYGLLQATAVRYQDPVIPTRREETGLFNNLGWHNRDKRPDIHHTDELVWRVLQDEMAMKGYSQVAPEVADIVIIYYGGPRPQLPPETLRLTPHPFDQYFAQNELKPQTFFVDVIDTKATTLIYRGWDNATWRQDNPDAQRVINSVKTCIGFFPSKR